jgi:hypothetical protein
MFKLKRYFKFVSAVLVVFYDNFKMSKIFLSIRNVNVIFAIKQCCDMNI